MRALRVVILAMAAGMAGLALAPSTGQADPYWHGRGYYRPPPPRYWGPPPPPRYWGPPPRYYAPPPPAYYRPPPPAYYAPPPRYYAPPPPPPGFGFYIR